MGPTHPHSHPQSNSTMLSPAQQGVVRGVVTAILITAAATALHTRIMPALAATVSTSSSSSPAGRTLLWLKWNLPKALTLAAHIGRVGNHRFFTPADIGGSGQAQSTPQVGRHSGGWGEGGLDGAATDAPDCLSPKPQALSLAPCATCDKCDRAAALPVLVVVIDSKVH